MDRSELALDLELALEPQTVRTQDSARPAARPAAGSAPAPAAAPLAIPRDTSAASAVAALAPAKNPFELAFPPVAPARQPDVSIAQYGLIAAKYAGYTFAGWLALVLGLLVLYRFADPPVSALMLQHKLSGDDYRQIWVPIEAISPQALRAVLVSEDGRFCQHWGIDYDAMQDAIERAGEGPPRGASTISMQVIKNLFLWPSKSYVRKIIEIPLTYVMELLWPKRRIMEVYLNIAEWGPGIFGIEAAARHHFAKSAYRLSEREAAQLAVALPNPIRRDAGDPGPRTSRLASHIQLRMRAAAAAASACLR